ncbi:MAG: hypothetical protein FWH27_05535 [Planctomycetaceae bacterium]|nr:hypothetical protein [Planctomycetaceae bacterium]
MTTSRDILIGLLLLGVMCLFGCKKKTEQTLPLPQHSVAEVQQEQQHLPPGLFEPASSLDAEDAPEEQDNVPPDPGTVKTRFEPLRNPGTPVVLAEQERKRTGFQPGGDFSLDAVVSMGELLRKEWPQLPPLDERALRSHAIRVIKGKHLTLYTDLAAPPEINRLPEIFDLAVTEYCRFFGVDPKYCAAWHMQGCLIDDLEKFRAAGLLGTFPTHLPGYSVDDRLWVLEQKSDYFRRHLLLHEGVHGFMNFMFGTCGPVWYMESTAEYLATHRWENGRLELGVMPENTDAVPGWRRIELVKNDVQAGNLKTADRVMRYSGRQLESPTDYAWVWTFGFLLDRHPQYREVYRDMARWLTFRDFSNRFYLYVDRAGHWNELQIAWLGLLDELEYGYDVPRMVIKPPSGKPLTSSEVAFDVDVTGGWQSSGVMLEAGQTCRVTASGQYRLEAGPQVWYAEPNGVTFRYHNGQPLGLLLGAVVPDGLFETDTEISPDNVPFLFPILIGQGIELTPEQSGTLYLRINDSPAELGDNQGKCKVVIEANEQFQAGRSR